MGREEDYWRRRAERLKRERDAAQEAAALYLARLRVYEERCLVPAARELIEKERKR